jgi:hypothetical protein
MLLISKENRILANHTHLHLAVRDSQGNLIDPVAAGVVTNCKKNKKK